jgi:hypothetical protein
MRGSLVLSSDALVLNTDDVIVNPVEPEMRIATQLHRGAQGVAGAFLESFKALCGRRPEDGTWTYIDAAVVKERESHGCFCLG